MLINLNIKNYALIDHLNVNFTVGFTIITGETGAGKSILLGGLSLVLGKRADLSSLRNKDQKCIIEAEFQIEKYNLKSFFTKNNLDYDSQTIIRREILPSGKSRAFVNDTPITLNVLSELGNKLIDVHSQNQTLQLTNTGFQFKVIDALADNKTVLSSYRDKLNDYNKASKDLAELINLQSFTNKEHDYNSFLLQELEGTPLTEGIQEELEEQYNRLNNVEIIIEQLSKGAQLLNNEQVSVVNLITELKQVTSKLVGFGNQYEELNERIESVCIEIDDISNEFQNYQESTETNPQLLHEVSAKLQLLYDLQKKHNAQSVSELIVIKEQLVKKVTATQNIEEKIAAKEEKVAIHKAALKLMATTLSNRRKKILPQLKSQLESSLASLGMPSATFKIEISTSEKYKIDGNDDLIFLFSANKGMDYGELKKVASGGELSRIMLIIKSILATYENLPTIMFDEIDTGVSGEISNKMADIMQAMSKTMQVFSITHLPQVASKGNHHFKVFKADDGTVTHTQIKELTQDERVVELAEMLGGKDISDSAMAHARQLLN